MIDETVAGMIEYKCGDMLGEDVEALVNAVNCVGVMGAGIALQFKKAFPENFKAYRKACGKQEVQPGRMFVFAMKELNNPRYIINFPTKRHWREKSCMEDIEAGLQALAAEIRKYGIRSIAIPPLGCGLGGLSWLALKPCIEVAMRPFTDVRTILYAPEELAS